MNADSARPTAELAEFAASLRYDQVPAAVVEHVKLALVDLSGCVLYGSTLPWTRIMQDYVAGEGARPVAPVWGTGDRTSPSLATLANGTAAHAAEIDDLHKASFIHPSAAVVPAALAVAESPAIDGRALLTALVAGYEVGTRVGRALGQQHFTRGYHPQGTAGVFAAAAAAGRVLGLDADRMVHALGIAGTQASGLMAAQEGAMVKRAHAGLAGQTGVRAALLAARGFTGIENVFEADFGGLLGTLGTAESDPSALTDRLGGLWHAGELEFKWHAACAAMHSCLDVVEDLCAIHGLKPADVQGVTIHCTTHAFLHCGFRYRPSGVTAAQMSFQYGVAAMITFGVVGIDQFADDLLADAAMLDLAGRVQIVPEPRFDDLGPAGRHTVEVEIRTGDEVVVVGARDSRRGGIDDPVSPDRVVEKYRNLAAHAVDARQSRDLYERIMTLDATDDVRTLTALLAVPGSGGRA